MSQLSKEEITDLAARGESLRGVNLVRTDMSGLILAGVDLSEANLRMADLSGADLREAQLTGCSLSGAILNQADLTGANLVESSLIGVVLRGSNLSRADLSGADLTGANLQLARLTGAYMMGAFLNETDLSGCNLSGAYIRMAQMGGSNLTGAIIEGADLSYADLSGARLDGCCLAGANLTGAKLTASSLTACDLRGADLSGADLSGCNLSGAKLRDIKFTGVKLDDAWADWVDLSDASGAEDRASFEDFFISIVGKPLAQIVVESTVSDDVWAVVLAHLCEFQITHPDHSDVRLKALQQGISSSAIYLEARSELSLAAYLADFADIMGKGSVELFEKLAEQVSSHSEQTPGPKEGHLKESHSKEPLVIAPPSLGLAEHLAVDQLRGPGYSASQVLRSRVEALERTSFWISEKAVVILTGNRDIWLEAASNRSLTLRPPRGAPVRIDLLRGEFVLEERIRNKSVAGNR